MFKFGSKKAYKKQAVASAVRAEYDHLLKFLMVGDHGVGKSCLMLRFTDNTYFSESYISTIGVDFKIRTLELDGKRVKCQIWDTTGQERFRTITSSYYRGAQAIMIVYDITNRDSFNSLERWLDEVGRQSADNTAKLIVGNKCDKDDQRQVSKAEAEAWCRARGLMHMEASSKTAYNVEEAFATLARESPAVKDAAPRPAAPKSVAFAEANNNSSDEECFSDDELASGVSSEARISSGVKSNRHAKINSNLCNLDLTTLTTETVVATGDPIKCPKCSAVLSYSALASVTTDPEGLLKKRRTAPPPQPTPQPTPQPITPGGPTLASDPSPMASVGNALTSFAASLGGIFGLKKTMTSDLSSAPSTTTSTASIAATTATTTTTSSSATEATATAALSDLDETDALPATAATTTTATTTPATPATDALIDEDASGAAAAVSVHVGAEEYCPEAKCGNKMPCPDHSKELEESQEEAKELAVEPEHEEKKEGNIKYWVCEFCDTFVSLDNIGDDEIPTSNTVDYLIEPAPSVQSSAEKGHNIVFVVDISGSMCVTTEISGSHALKGNRASQTASATGLSAAQLREFGDQYMPRQSRATTFVSRLQCVQAAVEAQIERIAREHPQHKVGLIVFSNEVTILGDGTQEPENVAGDKLKNWQQLVEIGERYRLAKPVQESKESLLKALWALEEGGQTALGPALHLGVSIAGAVPLSQVVLCTDGLANLGLGTLEGKLTEFSPYYTEVSERAKLLGVTVNVVTLEGTACAVENLAVVTAQTSGEVTRVDPLKLTSEFSAVLSNQVLATGCFAMVLLHKGLQFRGELDDEEDPTRNWLVRDIGNVTASTAASFSYGFRPRDVIDLSSYTEIPFQVQVTYNKPDGSKYMRCVTQTIPLTNERAEAERLADVKAIGTYAAQRAARYARDGNYEQCLMESRAANRFLMRNAVEEKDLASWQSNVESMDRVIRDSRQREVQSAPSESSAAGSAQEVRAKSRQISRAKADTVSVAIHQQQAKSGGKIWGSK